MKLLFAVALFDDFLSDVRWNFLIAVKLHSRSGATLGHTTKIGGVAKHVCKRHEAGDDLNTIFAVFHAVDAATARVKITNDVTHEFFRSGDFDLHDRLEKYWFGLFDTFAGSEDTSKVEGELGGVNIVVRTIIESSLNVEYWIASDNATFESFLPWLAYDIREGRHHP